jgi:hypothetical protein
LLSFLIFPVGSQVLLRIKNKTITIMGIDLRCYEANNKDCEEDTALDIYYVTAKYYYIVGEEERYVPDSAFIGPSTS